MKPLSTQPSFAKQGARSGSVSSEGRRSWGFLLRVTLIVIFVVLAYKVVRAGLYGFAVYDSGLNILALREDGDLDGSDFVAAQASLSEIARSTAAMEREMRFFAPALRATGIVPGTGTTIAAVPNLLAAGKDLTSIGSDSLALMVSAMDEQDDAPLLDRLFRSMSVYGKEYQLLAERAQQAELTLAEIPVTKMLAIAGEPTGQLQSVTRLMNAGLRMAPVLPELMGADGPRTYLLLVQNNHELRATGGFISAVGKVTVKDGKIGDIELTDSYNIKRNDVDHPWAPEPMREYMGIDLVFVRDANWSPDLHTTARLVRALYLQDAGVAVDGMITIDLRAVELLVGGLAPLEVPGASEAVTGENLIDQIKQFWDQPIESGDTIESAGLSEWWTQRKDFMPALAEAALARLKSGNFNYLALAQALQTALDERAIQIWVTEPLAMAELANMGWDGAIHPIAGADFIGLVDTNMGYNKVDSVLERSVRHEVEWGGETSAAGLATTTITYRHPVEVVDHACNNAPRYGTNYDDMTRRCYFNYVRLYVPAGSELVSMEGVEPDSVANHLGENGTRVFGGYFTQLPGTEHAVTLTYTLPDQIMREGYSLVVRRQSGAGPLVFSGQVGNKQVETTIQNGEYIWTP